ncbi:MAG: IS21 family transposase, partial [Acidobacteriota bacterium]|nr:IS21 family transposase [Acidobacteriota bacterium]
MSTDFREDFAFETPTPEDAKPARAASTGSGEPGRSATTLSACEPHRDFIELSLAKGRNAHAIYQDLVD